MRFSKVLVVVLALLTSFASFSLAQLPYESSSQISGWNSPGCSVYGGCAAVQNTAGCSCNQECHNGLFGFWSRDRAYFEYEPILPCPGDRVNSIIDVQKFNGRIAQMVVYNCHFAWNVQQQTWNLNRSGWIHVQELVRIIPGTPGPIKIAPSGDPATDQLRVQLVRDALAIAGVSHAPQLVLQEPDVHGLDGDEALRIHEQRQLGSPYSAGTSTTSNISLGRSSVNTPGR